MTVARGQPAGTSVSSARNFASDCCGMAARELRDRHRDTSDLPLSSALLEARWRYWIDLSSADNPNMPHPRPCKPQPKPKKPNLISGPRTTGTRSRAQLSTALRASAGPRPPEQRARWAMYGFGASGYGRVFHHGAFLFCRAFWDTQAYIRVLQVLAPIRVLQEIFRKRASLATKPLGFTGMSYGEFRVQGKAKNRHSCGLPSQSPNCPENPKTSLQSSNP